jgi:CRP/FNR family cyclic AMP-dependent transcriptional regulator
MTRALADASAIPMAVPVASEWPFMKGLDDEQRQRVRQEVTIQDLAPDVTLCHRGSPVRFWVGVLSGVVKIEATSPHGKSTILANMGPGFWFGEGSVLKGGCWPYDAVSINPCRIALMPAATFQWLVGHSLAFNRFLLDLMNARLGQFIERCEHERLHTIDRQVAHFLTEMIDPRLGSIGPSSFSLSQDELAHLAGVSRPVVNRVLRQLVEHGLVELSYGSIKLVDVEGLRQFSQAWH